MGIYSEFVPVHVQVSELVLVPESEIEIYKPSGEQPVTKYRIGPAQIEKVNEYFAQKTMYSPWALKKKSYTSEEPSWNIGPGLILDFNDFDEEKIKKSRGRGKTPTKKARSKKQIDPAGAELAIGGL